MRPILLHPILVIAIFLGMLGNALPDEPLVWESRHTETAPAIDGKIDKAWEKAKPLIVIVREAIGGDKPTTVELRALNTTDTLYVLAKWPDRTRSNMRDPYVWHREKKVYERPTKPDDQFAIEFPISGDFDTNMLSMTKSFTADAWHWKAGRGNPNGWVDDKRHITSQDPKAGGKKYSMGGHGTVYVARPTDKGESPYATVRKPTSYSGDVVDSYKPQQPTGSRADVRGKGLHDGQGWTLEMSRKFNTGHEDDAVIDPAKDTQCAIAILNDELDFHHSVSSMLVLRFSGKGKKEK